MSKNIDERRIYERMETPGNKWAGDKHMNDEGYKLWKYALLLAVLVLLALWAIWRTG